jgi:TonB family protein
MKGSWLRIAVAGILASSFSLAQPASNPPEALELANGVIANGVYSNECLGFSLPIPAGWEMDTKVAGASGRAKPLAGGGLTLFFLRPQGKPSDVSLIHLQAFDATAQAGSVQEYVSRLVHQQAHSVHMEDGTLIEKELVRDASPVDYGSRHFFRAEFNQSFRGDTFYVGYVYTKFRGYFIGEELVAWSPEELNRAADSLLSISFREDERDPRCLQGPPRIGRIRVSEKIAQRLLVTKVDPRYPEDARQGQVEGPVVLKALIGTTGDVQEVTLVSGPQVLVAAAMEAVKQWKYKPFLLNGEAVIMETQISVSFSQTAK